MTGDAPATRSYLRTAGGVRAASWNGNTLPSCRDQPSDTVQVMRVTYRKIVRDQVPGIITADGHLSLTGAGRGLGGAGPGRGRQ
jgi:hypothetical protein